MSAVAAAERPRLDYGRVIRETFSALRRNWITVTLLVIIFEGLPYAFLDLGLYQLHKPLTWQMWLITVPGLRVPFATFLACFASAAITAGIQADRLGRKASIGACLAALRPVFGRLSAAALIRAGLFAIATALVVPAFVAVAIWPVVASAIVIERMGPLAGFRRAAALSARRRWAIFWLMLGFSVAAYVISYVANYALSWAEYGLGLASRLSPVDLFGVSRSLAAGIDAMISGTIGETMVAVLYFELRRVKEGLAPETSASVFD